MYLDKHDIQINCLIPGLKHPEKGQKQAGHWCMARDPLQ